ncbi:adenylosuccinate lyase, partial [Vibrio parahaemolyticus]
EVYEPFGAGQQGSSAMPHKRNPELAERICGLSRLLRGYGVTAMENVALWHERDISHSSTERIIIPDAMTLLHYMLYVMHSMIAGMEVDKVR